MSNTKNQTDDKLVLKELRLPQNINFWTLQLPLSKEDEEIKFITDNLTLEEIEAIEASSNSEP